MRYVFVSSSPLNTERFGRLLGGLLRPGDVVCLEGELGAGKTLLTRGIALGMGIEHPVSSPTYTLINEYPGNIPLYHFDAYRLESADDLYDIGGDDLLYGQGVSVIEWASRVEDALPAERLWIRISISSGHASGRLIELTAVGDRYNSIVEGVISDEGIGY
jgi:tRNA threonylcarbamoyladenosine biosynthesis protein TsaE